MHCHPGFEGVIVILRIRKDRDETRKIVRLDVAEQERGRHSVIQTGAGNEDRCRLRPLIFLPPSYPRSGPPTSVVLTD